MNQENAVDEEKKAAMKALRDERKEYVKAAAARVAGHNKAVKAIKEELTKGDGTVPEVAEATGIPADKVLWYMAALKKYGEIVEAKKDAGYFRYTLVGGAEPKTDE